MEHKAFTAQGNRELNEDSYACIERGGNYCFIVADGLGGHGKGEIASKKVTEVFEREFGTAREGCSEFLKRAFETAQADVMTMQQTADEMKTTAVALVIAGGKLAWGHIGDSRLYHFQRGRLRQRTLDHSVAQTLSLSKRISDADIALNPDRNILLRVIGEKWNGPRYELSKEARVKKGDAFLLCSDGIWESISSDTICKLLKQSRSAEEWLNHIISEVERNGRDADMDNYTAIAVRVL